LVKFLFVRVLALSVILAGISFFVFGFRPAVPAGALTGAFISVYKLRIYHNFLNYFTQNGKNTFIKSLLLNLFLQILTLGILVVALMLDVYFFFALAGGLLLPTAVICFNAFTEKIGLTHNEWRNSKEKDQNSKK